MTLRTDRRTFLTHGAATALIGLPLLSSSQFAGAQSSAQPQSSAPQEGADYIKLASPVPTESGKQIEVIEFFQYSCPHCFSFEPDLESWRKRQAADVAYKRVPVVFNPQTMPHAKLYYALEALKKTDELHVSVFKAYHVDKRRLLDPKDIADFMASNGVDRDLWLQTFDSFSVVTRANRAQQLWQSYKLEGTPMVGFDGRFMTGPSVVRAQSKQGAIVVMDWLVERIRSERGGRK